MTLILKQSTSIDIRMGPFVDATDAVTPETGITLAGADQAEVLKANGAATAAMAGTFAAVTGADGWYDYTVATGDVDTVGEVVFVVQDLSVCLPVFVRGYVVEEAVYDALYGAASAGPLQSTTAGRTLDVAATGEAGVDFANINGTLDAANIGADAITAAKIANGAIDAATFAAGAIDNTAIAAGAITATEASVNVSQISGDSAAADNLEAAAETIVLGTAQTGTLSTTQMTTNLTEATDDHYIGRTIVWRTGALLGQATDITDYAGTGGLLTFTAVTEAPANNDTFVII